MGAFVPAQAQKKPMNIVFFDLDRYGYRSVKVPEQLEALIEPLLAISGTKYLFIDEVQNVEGFEDVLNGFRTEGGFSIFITGSNSYLLIPVLILIMFITGLCIWGPTMGATAGLTAALGGTMAVRIIHYFMMFVFIIFIFIHVYLANIEGFAPSKLMFFGKEHEGLHYDVERHVVLAEEQK